jgi:hypothetical protein
VEVSLVWGILGYANQGDSFTPVYNTDFVLDDRTQRWLLDTCKAARSEQALLVREEVPCFMEAFGTAVRETQGSVADDSDPGVSYEWADVASIPSVPEKYAAYASLLPSAGASVTTEQLAFVTLASGLELEELLSVGIVISRVDAGAAQPRDPFPVQQDFLWLALQTFYDVDELANLYRLDVGTAEADFTGDIRYVRQRLRINVRDSAGTSELERIYEKWEEWMSARNELAPPGAKMIMVSSSWTRMSAESSIVRTTIWALAFSVCGCFAIVLIFTGNLLVSIYTVVTTVLAVALLFFWIICVFEWEFGAILAIGLTTFVGMAVDYTVHTSHAYHTSDKPFRRGRATDAMRRLGPAIVGGALTTGGATSFLFPCWIYPFFQLGVMLCLNTVITLFLTFFFLVPLLMICGPVGNCGDTLAFLRCLPCRGAGKAVEEGPRGEGTATHFALQFRQEPERSNSEANSANAPTVEGARGTTALPGVDSRMEQRRSGRTGSKRSPVSL